MSRRVVNGLGVVAPNGVGLDAFKPQNGALESAKKDPELERLSFLVKSLENWNFYRSGLQYFTELELEILILQNFIW
jgi:hypothetical protein